LPPLQNASARPCHTACRPSQLALCQCPGSSELSCPFLTVCLALDFDPPSIVMTVHVPSLLCSSVSICEPCYRRAPTPLPHHTPLRLLDISLCVPRDDRTLGTQPPRAPPFACSLGTAAVTYDRTRAACRSSPVRYMSTSLSLRGSSSHPLRCLCKLMHVPSEVSYQLCCVSLRLRPPACARDPPLPLGCRFLCGPLFLGLPRLRSCLHQLALPPPALLFVRRLARPHRAPQPSPPPPPPLSALFPTFFAPPGARARAPSALCPVTCLGLCSFPSSLRSPLPL
jgi:hypothetical protein